MALVWSTMATVMSCELVSLSLLLYNEAIVRALGKHQNNTVKRVFVTCSPGYLRIFLVMPAQEEALFPSCTLCRVTMQRAFLSTPNDETVTRLADWLYDMTSYKASCLLCAFSQSRSLKAQACRSSLD